MTRLVIAENEVDARELADCLLDCSQVCPRVWISCAGFPAGVRAGRDFSPPDHCAVGADGAAMQTDERSAAKFS